MATNRDIQDVDTLHCPICLQIYTKPKHLPCLHTFCESCLTSYIQTAVSKVNGGKCSFNCPVCRSVNIKHDQGIPLDKWGKQFPLNHQIVSLMDELTPKQTQTECGPCQRNRKSVSAKHWCKECEDSFCDGCIKFHNSLKHHTKHKIMAIKDVQETGDTSVYKEEPCSFHSGKYIEVFCIDHNLPCCVVCVATRHRGCGSVKSLEEMGEAYKETGDSEKFLKLLQCARDEAQNEVENLNARRRKNLKKLRKQKLAIMADFDKEIDSARKKLDHLQNTFHQKMEHIHKNNLRNEEINQKHIETFKNGLIREYTHLSDIFRNGPNWYLALSVHKTAKTLSDAQVIYQENIKQAMCVGYSTELTDKLKQLNNSIASKVHIEQVMSEDTVEIHSRTHSFDTSNWASINPLLNVNYKDMEGKNIDTCKIPSQKSFIWGGTYLDDERLVLCNYMEDKLHIFDNQRIHMADVRVAKAPFDSAFMRYRNASYVLVSCDPAEINVYRIMRSCQFKFTKSVNTEERVWGLDVIEESILAIGDNNIYIMDFDGNTYCKIGRREKPVRFEYEKHYYTKHKNKYIAVDKRHKLFFYMEGEKTLVCRALDGVEVFRYQNERFSKSNGIGVDTNGNVYVSCVDDGLIYQISNNGKDGRNFMSNLGKITYPMAIGFDPKGVKFFLTGVEIVEIFRIQEIK